MKTSVSSSKRSLSSDEAISAYGTARSTVEGAPLSSEELRKIDAYWRASLYLCMGMLYLKDNPLLREPLKLEHTKPRLLGHWGSDAGQSFTYTHFNRLINKWARLPWPLTFSYARAIQQPALQLWRGLDTNVKVAQDALLYRAEL